MVYDIAIVLRKLFILEVANN